MYFASNNLPIRYYLTSRIMPGILKTGRVNRGKTIMLSRLNKKQVFRGGGLYLGNTVLVLSVFTQSSIAHNEYFSRRDVLNVCNKISWRIIANNKIVDAKEGSWITEKKYSESIRNVIGKAIADCITEKHEFAGKNAGEIITFDVDPRKQPYTAENWNAVVLWNLIHVYNCEYKAKGKCNMEAAFNEVEARIKQKYAKKKKIDIKIQDAIRDIKEYARELNLQKAFHEFCDTRNWIGNERFKKAISPKILSIQITPNLAFYESGYINPVTKSWLLGYNEQIKENELRFDSWYYEQPIFIKLKISGILYDIDKLKIVMKPTNFSDQIKMEDILGTNRLSGITKDIEQKDIIDVLNYIITAKKPDDVESIYYDKKDGWIVKYKE